VHKRFWLGNLREGGHLEDLHGMLRWEDNIQMNLAGSGMGRHGLERIGSG
jgi:hypothetical protein